MDGCSLSPRRFPFLSTFLPSFSPPCCLSLFTFHWGKERAIAPTSCCCYELAPHFHRPATHNWSDWLCSIRRLYLKLAGPLEKQQQLKRKTKRLNDAWVSCRWIVRGAAKQPWKWMDFNHNWCWDGTFTTTHARDGSFNLGRPTFALFCTNCCCYSRISVPLPAR